MRSLKIYYLLLIVVGVFAGGCSKLLDPQNDNHNSFARVYKDPAYAEGLLMNAYNKLPTHSFSFNEVATDDAVTNDKFNAYLLMATGQWSANNNPVSVWDNANKSILYLNNLIPLIDTIKWSTTNADINKMFKARLKGEAYALRGLFRGLLLQNTAGKSTSGKLMGIQLYNQFLMQDGNFNLPRAGFTESVDSINADFNRAVQYLPMDFLDITSVSQLPPMYSTINITDYNTVFGKLSNQRITKRIVMGLKARVALLAASPAFANNDQSLWIKAANAAADVLNGINGIAGLDPNGHIFYQAGRVDGATVTSDQKEMLWRGSSNGMSNSLEKTMLPPGLNGNGQINPSQNLVDAFPAKNGYPISNPLSTFNPANPYDNRDPRLDLYIVRNGLSFKGNVIKTGVGGGVNAKDSILTSTRTGYYLRKLIREDINFNNDGSNSGSKKHFAVHIRYTELFLSYAEAANEAWGPTNVGTIATFSAKDVIAAIRKRAGITQPDSYLNSIVTKEEMRDLIRNERRLELCFEGFRFWDMRRWGLTLTDAAKGVNINNTSTTFQSVVVEQRVYQPYM